MIKTNAEWEFVGIYTDEGISGTSTTRREGFKRMIDDALSGKIDLIVTKSVSRFARNTVESSKNTKWRSTLKRNR
jgi:DNA invertase Pin-like site-specific DNA recombinase